MKSKFVKILVVFGVFALVASYTLYNNSEKEKVLLDIIVKSLDYGHYKAANINDDFSEKVFKLYLDRTDHNKNFLLKDDVDNLKKYYHKIDDEIGNKSYDFFDLSVEIINKRIKEANSYYKEILDKPFDFTKNETIELDGENWGR